MPACGPSGSSRFGKFRAALKRCGLPGRLREGRLVGAAGKTVCRACGFSRQVRTGDAIGRGGPAGCRTREGWLGGGCDCDRITSPRRLPAMLEGERFPHIDRRSTKAVRTPQGLFASAGYLLATPAADGHARRALVKEPSEYTASAAPFGSAVPETPRPSLPQAGARGGYRPAGRRVPKRRGEEGDPPVSNDMIIY